MMKNPILFYLFFCFALLDWLAVWRRKPRLMYAAKPATLLALIAWSWFASSGWPDGMLWFGLGLVFGLLGDMLLMLPPRFFMGGLAAFLVGHALYIIGFNRTLPPLNALSIGLLIVTVFLVSLLAFEIHKGLAGRRAGRRLQASVQTYALTLSLMLCSALLTLLRPDWPRPAAVLVSIGAALFVLSDTLLGFDRFVRCIRNGRLWVHIAYHLGQLGIILGVILRF
jgi:uncharacterized membrane protein YhhN